MEYCISFSVLNALKSLQNRLRTGEIPMTCEFSSMQILHTSNPGQCKQNICTPFSQVCHKYVEKARGCLHNVVREVMKVRKIGKSNSKNFKGKCKGMIPGISSSCFVLPFHSNAGVDVAYHTWVPSAAQDRRGYQRSLINSFCLQAWGESQHICKIHGM